MNTRSSGPSPSRAASTPGSAIGRSVASWRDFLASGLASLGVSPGALTWLGAILSIAAGACLAVGAGDALPFGPRAVPGRESAWPLAAAAFMLLAGAMDVLDGATARAAGSSSRAGALLDSTLDRVSDVAVYLGCAVHFAVAGNATLVALAFLAQASGMLVSYVKARAENLVESCGGGYWQRGERCALFLFAVLVGHAPAGLWLLGLGPAATVSRRLALGLRLLSGTASGAPADRWKRGSIGYDLATALALAFIASAPWLHPVFSGGSDPLRAWLE